ncbi:MAG: hypothetical protein JXB49_30545 [Bacteroidales bacterium]|nr:hypothetical protein [Bacteroidales bacterium]
MNLEELLVDSSRAVADIATDTVLSDTKVYYPPLVEMAFSGKPKYSERACRIMAMVNQSNKDLVKPYVKKIIHSLNSLNSSKQMNLLYLLIDHAYPLDDDELGILVSFCFDKVAAEKVTPGVKVLSLEVLLVIIKFIPELKDELIILIQDQLPKNSAGFKVRGNRALRFLSSI